VERSSLVETVTVESTISIDTHEELNGVGLELRSVSEFIRGEELQFALSSLLHNLQAIRTFLEHSDPGANVVLHMGHIQANRELERFALHLLSECVPRVQKVARRSGHKSQKTTMLAEAPALIVWVVVPFPLWTKSRRVKLVRRSWVHGRCFGSGIDRQLGILRNGFANAPARRDLAYYGPAILPL